MTALIHDLVVNFINHPLIVHNDINLFSKFPFLFLLIAKPVSISLVTIGFFDLIWYNHYLFSKFWLYHNFFDYNLNNISDIIHQVRLGYNDKIAEINILNQLKTNQAFFDAENTVGQLLDRIRQLQIQKNDLIDEWNILLLKQNDLEDKLQDINTQN